MGEHNTNSCETEELAVGNRVLSSTNAFQQGSPLYDELRREATTCIQKAFRRKRFRGWVGRLKELVAAARAGNSIALAERMLQYYDAIMKIPEDAFNDDGRQLVAKLLSNYMGLHSLAMMVADALIKSRSILLGGLLDELQQELRNELDDDGTDAGV